MVQLALSAPSNAVAAAVVAGGTAGAVTSVAAARPGAAVASYMAASVASYCWRRGVLHRWPSGERLGAAEVLWRHLAYEDDWHLPHGRVAIGRLMHAMHVSLWLLLFQPVYPLLEAALYPCDLAAFYFYYPKARGAGLVVDSRARRRGGARGSKAQVLRLDWHRFELNVGKRYPPPNPGRHPPSVLFNLPHLDLPQCGVRHWPWRQHTDAVERLGLLPAPPPASEKTSQQGSARVVIDTIKKR